MYMEDIIGYLTEFWGAAFSVILLICVLFLRRSAKNKKYFNDFLILFSGLTITLLSAGFDHFFNARQGIAVHIFLECCTPIEFISIQLMQVLLALHVLELYPAAQWKNIWKRVLWGVMGLYTLLILIDIPMNWFFYIDADNAYHRGSYFIVSMMFPAVVQLGCIILFLIHRKQFIRKMRGFLYLYLGTPVAAVIAQILVYGIPFVQISAVLISFEMFIGIQQITADTILEQELSHQSQEQQLMLAQLKPHFLYNSILAIEGIEGNPDETIDALNSFSHYIRGSLDSMHQTGIIPAYQELAHVRAYLDLQQLRYKGKLRVNIDMKETNFSLPPLSLQMLVENAIRHGFSKMARPGTVIIRSRAVADHYEIRVTDNGCGFDPAAFEKAPEGHVGLNSVRCRIEKLCGGDLLISSKIGEGTTAIIMIPKKED